MDLGTAFHFENGMETLSMHKMSSVISDLAVVNNTAGRSMKDVEEFSSSARDSDKQGKIVIIGDWHRIKGPEFKRALMEYCSSRIEITLMEVDNGSIGYYLQQLMFFFFYFVKNVKQ